MERWRHGEEVRERFVAIGLVEVKGVAGEDELASCSSRTADLASVVLGLAAIENGCCNEMSA